MSKRLAFALSMLIVSVRGLPQTSVTTDNTSRFIGNGRWEWTVFIKADPATLSQIRCVEYLLHPTFPNRDRRVCQRGSTPGQAFPLTANGWGTFDIPVTVIFNNGKTQSLTHHLRFDSPPVEAPSAPPGCNVANSFSISEHGIQPIGADWPGVYLYAEEIHKRGSSHFYLIKSAQAIQPGNFNWSQHSQRNNPRRTSVLSNTDNNAYVSFSPPAGTSVRLPLRGSTTAIYFKDPQEHKSIGVLLCK